VYRHFATKEALVDALVADRLQRVLEVVDAARADPDPWSAFVGVLRALAVRTAADQCLDEVFEGRAGVGPEVLELKQRVYASIRALMRRAQDAGVLRPDLAPGDLALVLAGIRPAHWAQGERGRQLSERYLTIVVDGLRAPGATPLPHRPLAKRELDELFAAGSRPAHRAAG
jgi:AcrR family transcriptional regulator